MNSTVYGVPLSPFVRKVLIALEMLGVDYTNNPFTPIDKPADFNEISPLGKIPAFKDNDISVADSSVICSYIDAKYGPNVLYPADLVQRTKALWFEEYADSKVVELLGHLFFERVVKPVFLKQETDQASVDKTINDDLPPVLAYLESQAPNDGFMVGDFSIADIALGTLFLNAKYAKWEVSVEQYPSLAAYINRIFAHSAFQTRMAADAKMMQQ